jgi:hypothetical protein
MLVLIQNVGEVGKSNGRLVREQVGTVFAGRGLASLFHFFQKLLHFLAVFIKELFRFRRSFGVQLGRVPLLIFDAADFFESMSVQVFRIEHEISDMLVFLWVIMEFGGSDCSFGRPDFDFMGPLGEGIVVQLFLVRV